MRAYRRLQTCLFLAPCKSESWHWITPGLHSNPVMLQLSVVYALSCGTATNMPTGINMHASCTLLKLWDAGYYLSDRGHSRLVSTGTSLRTGAALTEPR
jgi:hypothetical protein